MSEILTGLPGVVNLMDDILIFGDSKAQHDSRLLNVLAKLAQSNVTLNKAKCVFGVRSISYLGHLLSKEGV